MNWNLNIPKILHFYWGGGILPYIRFMTIKSFMKFNPNWEIMFWYPKYPFIGTTWNSYHLKYEVDCDDYLFELMDLPIKKTSIDFEDYGFKNDIAEVHKTDILRSLFLNIYGGLWVDMDIIFFKSINELEINCKENREKENYICIGPYGHSIGFMMSLQGSKFFENITSLIKTEFNPNVYQSVGPDLLNKYFPTIELIENSVNLSMDIIYAHNANHIHELIDGSPSRFTKNSIGCHWYAGHPQWNKFLKETNGGLINLQNNVIGNLLDDINFNASI